MLFNSYQFLLFYPVVLIIFMMIPRRWFKWKRIWLFLCSLFFYSCWNPRHLILLVTCIATTYCCGLLLDRTEGQKMRRLIVAFGLIINFGLLFFFKYSGFFVATVNSILSRFGLGPYAEGFDVTLPVGISFYTFQSVGYIIDVFRKEIPAEKDPVKYGLFVSFFPQLVAGPIERSKNILSQIDVVCKEHRFDPDMIKSGFIYMFWGFFLKMVIADRISILVDNVFDRYYAYGTIILIIAVISFSLQIYCDFASYSCIAVGSARILGFTLMENFETPYFSRTVREFWRRWHISLSTWFRDYLYIPLGGSRCSKLRKYINIMITFMVSGLWHGADWTFVFWGGLHGLYQVAGDITLPFRKKIAGFFMVKTESFGHRFAQMIVTFALTSFAWLFFRADSITDALAIVSRMFSHFDPWTLTDKSIYTLGLDVSQMHILWFSLLILIAVSILRYHKGIRIDSFICSQGSLFQAFAVYALLMIIMIFGKYGASDEMNAFIYFRF
ncbi:MAG: MBOAT family protein [Lachnospiraceae bacterium]|nr:MBOAT family protein [Lachnospiraceae bacterium]